MKNIIMKVIWLVEKNRDSNFGYISLFKKFWFNGLLKNVEKRVCENNRYMESMKNQKSILFNFFFLEEL